MAPARACPEISTRRLRGSLRRECISSGPGKTDRKRRGAVGPPDGKSLACSHVLGTPFESEGRRIHAFRSWPKDLSGWNPTPFNASHETEHRRPGLANGRGWRSRGRCNSEKIFGQTPAGRSDPRTISQTTHMDVEDRSESEPGCSGANTRL